MTTTLTCTRPVNTPAYYLGRPAALWLAALSPSRKSPPMSCAGESALLASGQ